MIIPTPIHDPWAVGLHAQSQSYFLPGAVLWPGGWTRGAEVRVREQDKSNEPTWLLNHLEPHVRSQQRICHLPICQETERQRKIPKKVKQREERTLGLAAEFAEWLWANACLSEQVLCFLTAIVSIIAEFPLHGKPAQALRESLTLTAPEIQEFWLPQYRVEEAVGLLLWRSTAKGMKHMSTGSESLLFHLLHFPKSWFVYC